MPSGHRLSLSLYNDILFTYLFAVVKELNVDDCDIHDGRFLCADRKKCIKVVEVCNRHSDCDDGSDEGRECYNLGKIVC